MKASAQILYPVAAGERRQLIQMRVMSRLRDQVDFGSGESRP